MYNGLTNKGKEIKQMNISLINWHFQYPVWWNILYNLVMPVCKADDEWDVNLIAVIIYIFFIFNA